MGSRITRALYKQQRKLPIKKEREEEIKVLIVCFLGGINTIFFFLFGYLFRPHIRTPNSVALFLFMLILFLFLQLKQINRATIISSVGLFAAIVLAKILGLQLSLLKAALILTTTTLSAVTTFEVSQSPFLQTFFLWFAYSSFGLGVKLSLAVSKINIERNVEGVEREESMLVQVIFSLVGIMSIFLTTFGKRILKQKASNDQNQKQTAFGKQLLYGCLNLLLIAFSFAFKFRLEHLFVYESIGLAITTIIIIIIKKMQWMRFIWIGVGLLAAFGVGVDFVTQSEELIAHWTNFIKILMIDLAVIDAAQRWISWSNNGTDKPILIVFLYFSGFYLSQYSLIGVKIFSIFSAVYLEAVSLSIYAVLLLVHRLDQVKVESYEEVV